MNPVTRLLCLLSLSLLAPLALSQQALDIDQADSLDFESFHQKKDDAIMLYDGDSGEVLGIKTGATATDKLAKENPPTSNKVRAVTGKQGQQYEIRELYSITGSNRTGYNPTTVMQAILLQVQGLCSQGWRKLDERSEPDGEEFYLYYLFECL
jgi:hypothetical protein